MAFGPSTDMFQQAIQLLMQGRAPSPVAPVPIMETVSPPTPLPLAPTGNIGPLSLETAAALRALAPEPVPPSLPGPVDAEAIRSRFAGLAGPEPVAPTPEPTSLIIRIARALQGFGAGVQGQGPQFLAQLQEQRERPQREFKAQKERFDARQQELGVMAEQAILTAEDRRMARTTELLDRQADRDFQESLKRSGIKSQEAIARMKEAFDLERDARKAEAERLERERKDAKERKAAVTTLANTFTDDFKISRQQALKFAEHEINKTPLGAADAKAYSRIEKYRPAASGTGGGSTGPVMAQLENGVVVPLSTVNRDTGRVVLNGKPLKVIGYVGGRIPNQPLTPEPLPGEPGGPQGPFVPPEMLRGGQAALGDNEISLQELQQIATRQGISLEKANAKAKAEGLIVR